MKVSVDDVQLFELSEIQKKVICNEICCDDMEADLKRRLEYILMHKYEQCYKNLFDEWFPKLSERFDIVPTNPEKFAELVFSQEDYKDRKMRDALDKGV